MGREEHDALVGVDVDEPWIPVGQDVCDESKEEERSSVDDVDEGISTVSGGEVLVAIGWSEGTSNDMVFWSWDGVRYLDR
jgi:hypothetical protein